VSWRYRVSGLVILSIGAAAALGVIH
jgi:hypothetical protein